LSFNHITCFQDQLWCIAYLKGIYVFDLNLNFLYFFSPEALSKSGIKLTKHSSFVNIEDKQLYLFPRMGGFILSDTKKTWRSVIPQSIEIFDVLELPNKKFIGSNFNGLRILDLNTPAPKLLPAPIFNDSIWYEILSFSPGYNKLLCAENGLKLNLYNWINDSFQLDTTLELKSYISCSWQDAKTDFFWIGTDIGLWKLDLSIPALTHIGSVGEHFPIQKIISDRDGNIWCAGTKGILCYHPSIQKTTKFIKEDGFLSNSFNLNAGCCDATGSIYYGSNEGITCFNPSKVTPYPHSPRVYVKKLRINNLPFSPQDTVVAEKKFFIQ